MIKHCLEIDVGVPDSKCSKSGETTHRYKHDRW